MLNIGGFGKNGFAAPVGADKKETRKPHEKTEKKDRAEKNFDRADFSSHLGKANDIKGGMRVGAASEKTGGLSKTAQDYLEKLRKKYGNMDFIVADFSSDEEADKLLGKGKGEYNVLITPDLLEKMAADESVAAEYEGLIDQSVESIDGIKEGLGEDADMVEKYGVTIDRDGNVSLRAKLIDGLLGKDGSDTVKASTVEDMLAQLKEAKESQAEKLAKIREEKASKTAADTDDADKEVEKLKDEKQKIMSQIRTERNEDKKGELELMLKQLEGELQQKDNDAYRKAHAHFTAKA